MAATYANSLLVEDGDAFLLESRHELSLQSVPTAVAADTFVGLKVDAVRASGDDTPLDDLVISDPTDLDDGDSFVLQGVTVTMSKVATAGGFTNQAVLPQFSRGLTGGPAFRTIVQEVADGGEMRISKWQRPKRTYDIASAIDTREDFRKLMSHYKQVRGSLDGFRMRDPFDWSTHPNHVTKPDATQPTHRQLIGAGDGTTTTYQLCKRYKVGNVARVRPITHPQIRNIDYVNEIFVDGTQQTEGVDFSWVFNGGQIEFVNPPAAGTAIYWCGTFDVPVRFDQTLDQGLLADMATETAFQATLTATELSVPEPFSDHKWMGGAYAITITQDEILDISRGRFWLVRANTSGLKLYLPSTKHLLDGGEVLTVRSNSASTASFDIYNYENSSAKLTTVTVDEYAKLILCEDGNFRAIQ